MKLHGYMTALLLGTALVPGTCLSAQNTTEASSKKLSMNIFMGDRKTEENCKIARWGPKSIPSPAYAFRAEKIVPVEGDPIHKGVILIKNSKIIAIGKASEVEVPSEYQLRDMGDVWIMPGLVDLHCHIAGASRRDINDSVHATNPELRTVDLITLQHATAKDGIAGGVTSVLYIPGSGSNMGGFGTLTKLYGDPQEALIRFPGSLKIAQAGNPERRAGDLGSSRMGMNQGLRFTLKRGYDYYKDWEDFDAGKGPKPKLRADLEYLRGLFRHEYPISVHTQWYQVVLATIRELRLEFGLWTFIDHGTFGAYRLSGFAKESGVPVCNGPRQYYFDPNQSKFIGLANAWYAGGMHGWLKPVEGLGRDGIGINTDSPVVPQHMLPQQCAMAVRLGLPWEIGIRAITINPARFVGIDHRVGSLRVGKDADLAVWTGDPLDPRSHVKLTVVNGRIAYERDDKRPRF